MGKHDEINSSVEELRRMLLSDTHEDSKEEKFFAAIERIQQESFMDGYRYAIAILKESIVKKQ